MALIQTTGNLLNSDAQYIAHQCNCISKNASGLAGSLFKRFPYSNTYETRTKYLNNCESRTKPNEVGTIEVLGNGEDKRYVINMYAQYHPGPPQDFRGSIDSYNLRRNYFFDCLRAIRNIPNLKSIGIPYGIGCGLAKGNWPDYLALISGFSKATPAVDVIIYRLLD